MDTERYWLLTWTTYGTWLPGDRRGSVVRLRAPGGPRRSRNIPGTPSTPAVPGLERAARASMRAPPVRLTQAQARSLLLECRATADARGWVLFAAAVMANHVHLVVGVPGDPAPDSLLRSFKGRASRAMNLRSGTPGRLWWTTSGSARRLAGEAHVLAAREYVANQRYPLAVWVPPWDAVAR